ncbi:MAG: hypothetical protein ACP5H7_01130 [Minisyncoccia bacterium]
MRFFFTFNNKVFLKRILFLFVLFLSFSFKTEPIFADIGLKDCCILRTTVDLGEEKVCYKTDKVTIVAESVEKAQSCCSQCSSYQRPTKMTSCENYNGSVGCYCENSSTSWGLFCLIDSIQYTTNWIFYILTIIVVVMAIWGAATIITSAGNPDSMTKGKQILTYALIGLVLALVAKLLPSIVQFIVMK